MQLLEVHLTLTAASNKNQHESSLRTCSAASSLVDLLWQILSRLKKC